VTARLPEAIKERILTFGEYRMGVYKVALVMKDGSRIENVLVAWGSEVVRVEGSEDFDIDVASIVDAEDRA
jgi:hypothetical protein